MLDIALIRNNPELVKKGIATKNANPDMVDAFLALDQKWRNATTELDKLRALQRTLSEERKIDEAKANKEQIKKLEYDLQEMSAERDILWARIPNIPLPDVVLGKSDADNIVLREVGERTHFKFSPKDYLAIAYALGIIDTERAAKVSGSRFGYLLGDMVLLEFALLQFATKILTDKNILRKIITAQKLKISEKPFIPVLPPVLISKESMSAMGYLERGEDEIYHLPKDNLYIVGTSEQSLGPMHMNETFQAQDLPLRYFGFSSCFRREAGSYGKDTKGILRVHQFNKSEMFTFVLPEASQDEHEFLLAIEEYLMQQLEIPYHVLNICTADLGDPAAKKYDVEAWLPGQLGGEGEYRETHSTSNCTDYQARRLNVKFRPEGNAPSQYVHTLNGTVFSERPLIAIIENYQTEDGKIEIPKVLQPYIGKKIIG